MGAISNPKMASNLEALTPCLVSTQDVDRDHAMLSLYGDLPWKIEPCTLKGISRKLTFVMVINFVAMSILIFFTSPFAVYIASFNIVVAGLVMGSMQMAEMRFRWFRRMINQKWIPYPILCYRPTVTGRLISCTETTATRVDLSSLELPSIGEDLHVRVEKTMSDERAGSEVVTVRLSPAQEAKRWLAEPSVNGMHTPLPLHDQASDEIVWTFFMHRDAPPLDLDVFFYSHLFTKADQEHPFPRVSMKVHSIAGVTDMSKYVSVDHGHATIGISEQSLHRVPMSVLDLTTDLFPLNATLDTDEGILLTKKDSWVCHYTCLQPPFPAISQELMVGLIRDSPRCFSTMARVGQTGSWTTSEDRSKLGIDISETPTEHAEGSPAVNAWTSKMSLHAPDTGFEARGNVFTATIRMF